MLFVYKCLEETQMIKNRLKELRKKRGIKVESLVEIIGISSVYYYDLEKGTRRLNEDIINLLADYYKVSTDYILGRDIAENQIFNPPCTLR